MRKKIQEDTFNDPVSTPYGKANSSLRPDSFLKSLVILKMFALAALVQKFVRMTLDFKKLFTGPGKNYIIPRKRFERKFCATGSEYTKWIEWLSLNGPDPKRIWFWTYSNNKYKHVCFGSYSKQRSSSRKTIKVRVPPTAKEAHTWRQRHTEPPLTGPEGMRGRR